MFRKYTPEEVVPAGYYVRSDTWEIVSLPADGALPEDEDVTYYRAPLPLVMLAGPTAGLVWFLLLPVLIPAVVAYVAFGKLRAALTWAPRRLSERSVPSQGRQQGK